MGIALISIRSSVQSTSSMAPPTNPTNAGSSALKRKAAGDDLPISASTNQGYQISATLNTTNPGPQAWPNSSAPGRPTLTGGLPAGRISGALALAFPRVIIQMSAQGHRRWWNAWWMIYQCMGWEKGGSARER